MQGKCFLFTDQGGGADFCFYSDTNSGYDSTYSLRDAKLLEIFHPIDGNLIWSGSPKGKNIQSIVKLKYIAVGPAAVHVDMALEWYHWFLYEYPAILTGAGKSWAHS